MAQQGELITARIYLIKHNDKPVYVGFTRIDLQTRLYWHYSESRKEKKNPFYVFLRQNQDVTIELLEQIEFAYNNKEGFTKALDLERHYIYLFRSQGHKLYNAFATGKNSPAYENKPSKEATVLSKNLRAKRKQLSLTQVEASKAIGIKRSLLGAYEEARAEPSLNMFLHICKVYGVTDVVGFIKKDISEDLIILAQLQQSA